MKFEYSGYSAAGASVQGTIEARDRQSARDALRRDGTIVLKIAEKSDPTSSPPAAAQPGTTLKRKRVSTGSRLRRVCMFARQLQVLLASGTPILQSLSAVQRQGDNAEWRGVLQDVYRKLEEGSPLSEGLRTHPEYFDALTLSLVAAGEASGNMPAMFERLSTLTRKQIQLRSAIIGALVYPCLLLAI